MEIVNKNTKAKSKDQNEEAGDSKTVKKTPIVLPDFLTMVRQPNSVTNAKYDFTLIQQRILLTIIKHLQPAITEHNNGGVGINQLSLFSEEKESVRFEVKLKDVCKYTSNYKETIEAVSQIANIPFHFAIKDPKTGNNFTRVGGLFTAYMPDKYGKTIQIKIDKEVAKNLIMLNAGYTSFAYEIAFNAKNKYTMRIYQLISRWKDLGGYRISMDDFRGWLGLDEKYKDYFDIKRRILDPAYKELHERADCWFEVASVEKEGKAVKYLQIKIITTRDVTHFQKLKDNNYQMLKMHFGFTEEHLEKIRPILQDLHLAERLRHKILELHQHMMDSKTHIGDKASYAVKSIFNEFKKEK